MAFYTKKVNVAFTFCGMSMNMPTFFEVMTFVNQIAEIANSLSGTAIGKKITDTDR